MTDKQWTNPLQWDTYHNESKFHIWEPWNEWFDEWDTDMGKITRIIMAAKNYRRAQRLEQKVRGWFPRIATSTDMRIHNQLDYWRAELDAALLDLPRGLQGMDDHGEKKA